MLCCSLLVIVWFPLIGRDVTESSGLSRVPEYLLVVFQYNDYLMNKEEKKKKDVVIILRDVCGTEEENEWY